MPDPNQVVRVYPMHWAIRAFAVAFLAFGFLGFTGVFEKHPGFEGPNSATMVEWAGIAVFALGFAIYVFTAFVILYGNAIEQRNLGGSKRLRFDMIRGRREQVFRNFDGSTIRYAMVIPKDAYLPPLKFQRFYGFDSQFYDWYNHLPDLDSMTQSGETTKELT
ncbi:MAG TPA: hypothetical protein VKR52_01140 [Terracidiphilus sp.]|nr:hypothetical protein [Terracidiphilus sp.]